MKRGVRTSLHAGDDGNVFFLLRILALASVSFFTSCATYNPVQDFTAELEQFSGSGIIVRDMPGMDGGMRRNGLLVLNPFLVFWGSTPLDRDEVAGRLQTIDETGAIESQMQQLLEEHGLWSFAFYGTISEVEKRLEAGQPLLAIVQDNPMEMASRRYVVVIGFNREAEKILVHEGGPYPGVYTYARFRRMWRPVRNWIMAICPPDQMQWDMEMIEYAALARYRERKGEWAAALDSYARAMELEPDNQELTLAHADALFRSGRQLEAIAQYRKVLGRDEMNARAANNLAFVLADMNGDVEEAERLVRRAMMIEPMNPVFLDTLGYILLKSGRPREAADILSRALYRVGAMDIEEQRTIVTRLITAYLESNQPHLARQIVIERLKTDRGYILQDQLRQQIPE